MGANGWEKSVWTFLNSPFFLTLITIGLGSIVAALLTARWQRASLVFQLRIETIRRLYELFVQWGDAFYPPNQILIADRLAELKPTLEFTTTIFPGDEVVHGVEDVLNATVARSRHPMPGNPNQLHQLRDAAYDKFRVLMGILTCRVGVQK